MNNSHNRLIIIAICCFSLLFLNCQRLTPQPKLPVTVGTALPSGKTITLENTKKIVEMAQWTPQNYSGFVSDIDISSDNRLLAVGFSDGSYSILDPNTGNVLYQKNYSAETAYGTLLIIKFIADTDKLLLVYEDGTIILCYVDGTGVWETKITSGIRHISISDQTIALITYVKVKFISLADGRLVDEIRGTGLEFLSANQFILGTLNGQIELWQIEPRVFLRTLDRELQSRAEIFISPDKNVFLAYSENKRSPGGIRIFHAEDGSYSAVLWSTKQITDIAFSPNSTMIATSTFEDSAIQLWRTSDGIPLSRLLGHTMPIETIAFSTDGQKLFSGGYDGTIRVWGIP